MWISSDSGCHERRSRECGRWGCFDSKTVVWSTQSNGRRSWPQALSFFSCRSFEQIAGNQRTSSMRCGHQTTIERRRRRVIEVNECPFRRGSRFNTTKNSRRHTYISIGMVFPAHKSSGHLRESKAYNGMTFQWTLSSLIVTFLPRSNNIDGVEKWSKRFPPAGRWQIYLKSSVLRSPWVHSWVLRTENGVTGKKMGCL